MKSLLSVLWLPGMLLSLSHPACADAADTPASFNEIVHTRIHPQIERLVVQLAREGREMRIDGTPVFNGSDKFLPGKIALAFADQIGVLPAGDARRRRLLTEFRGIAKLTVDDANDSWGIYYYLSALNALNDAGLLQEALDPLTFAKLRVRLDWRTFVDVGTYKLIDHPSNYYCVAFAIARLRYKLGWDDGEAAERLYSALTSHYLAYSGPYGFSDETDGEGRFDRYSVLLAAEIAQRFIETGGTPPAQIVDWLRRSVDVMLLRVNPRGEGFEYGRSLGPYSETAIVEVLTAAAVVGLLDESQMELAYAYASRVATRYVEFWLDTETGSVNLWDDGRRTDAYRGRFRILGENFSLGHQFIYTNEHWNRLGYRNRAPQLDWDRMLASLPKRTVTWFARGEYDRMLLTLREGEDVISLPLINGGAGQHMHSPYYPIPFAHGLFDAVADGDEPLLMPRFELEDGTVLMPLAFMRDIEVQEQEGRTTVTYRQSELDRMGGNGPVADDRLSVRTTYVFEPGSITRTDIYSPRHSLAVKRIALAFGSFSSGPQTSGQTTRFASGRVQELKVSGLPECSSGPATGDVRYQTPSGPFASKVLCTRDQLSLQRPITIRWQLRYR